MARASAHPLDLKSAVAYANNCVLRNATHEHDIRHGLKHTEAVDAACHPDGQAFAGILIIQRHQPKLAAIVGLGLHEV